MQINDPRAARLALALQEGGLSLPETGRICVFGPRAGADLSAFPQDRVHVVQGFRPDHDAFVQAGFQTSPRLQGRYAAAVVCLPRSRDEGRDMVARAAGLTDGPVLVDGQKTDGIEPMLRACRALAAVQGPVTKAHGKLFWMTAAPPPEAFAGWFAGPHRVVDGFVTRPGVFSADGADPGSVLLAKALPTRLPARIADLGAGWGWLSAQILARDGVELLHLVEADFEALECARANISDARARLHWADATCFDEVAGLDAVIMNPPFHAGRKGDPGLGTAFIKAAVRLLGPQGQLWMVANRHLPYEAALSEAFRTNEEIGGSAAFKVHHARGPRAVSFHKG